MIKNSTKIFSASTVIVALIILISFYALESRDKVIIAKINNVKIYKSEVQKKLDILFSIQNYGNKPAKTPKIETLPEDVVKILLKEVYLEKNILKKAKQLKISKLPSIKAKVKESRNQIIRQAYIQKTIKESISQEDLLQKYAKLSDELKGKKEYLIYHIVSKTKKESWQVLRELKRGGYKNFSALAKKYSVDENSANNEGKLGYVLEDNIIPEIYGIIKNLKINYVSKPAKTKFGWHIIKVSEIRDAKPLPFDDVKDHLRSNLEQEAITEINKDITKDLNINILIDLGSDNKKNNEDLIQEDKISKKEPKKIDESKEKSNAQD